METKNAPKVTMWYLQGCGLRGMECTSESSNAARVVDVKSGEIFFVSDTYVSRNGENASSLDFAPYRQTTKFNTKHSLKSFKYRNDRVERLVSQHRGILRPVGDLLTTRLQESICFTKFALRFLNVRASQKTRISSCTCNSCW